MTCPSVSVGSIVQSQYSGYVQARVGNVREKAILRRGKFGNIIGVAARDTDTTTGLTDMWAWMSARDGRLLRLDRVIQAYKLGEEEEEEGERQ